MWAAASPIARGCVSALPHAVARRPSQARADVDKDRGNEHYKRKEFDEAISCYSRAIDTYPKEPSYYSNRAAVHLERGDLDACIADCDRAVEVVRETRGDLKMVARAWTRKATCLAKRGDLDAAIDLYQRALVSDRVTGSGCPLCSGWPAFRPIGNVDLLTFERARPFLSFAVGAPEPGHLEEAPGGGEGEAAPDGGGVH